MNKLLTVLFFALTIFITNIWAAAPDPTIQFPNEIAAVVEKKVITLEDVHRKAAPFIGQIQREVRSQEEFESNFNAICAEILEDMINQALLVREFKDVKKGKIPESYLQNHYAKFIEERFEGDRSKFIEFLKFQGMTQKEFEASQEDEIIVSFLRGELKQSLSEISPKKIKAYFEEHKEDFTQSEAVQLHQIMLAPVEGDDDDSSQLLENAQKLVETIRKGASFEAEAKEHSQDHLATKGGDWGWVERTDMREELADIAFTLDKGKTSDPVIVEGYAFILQVSDRREAGYLPLPEVRTQIEEIISNQEAERVQKKMVEKLRKKAHIQYFLGKS